MSAESHTALADAAPSTVSTSVSTSVSTFAPLAALATLAAAPEAPTKPAETPVEVPTRQDPVPGDPDQQDEPDIDEQIKRIIREIPDPTPQPGGE
jgi:hypothetical protein